MKNTTRISLAITLVLAMLSLAAQPAFAGDKVRSQGRSSVSQGKGGSPSRGSSSNQKRDVNVNQNKNKNVNVNQNKNVNRNTNVNVDRDIDVDIDVDHHHHGGGCCYDDPDPLAWMAAAVVTAVVVGTVVNSLPSGCQTVIHNGFAYQQCGNTWYQPQMSGSSTTYVVINAPY
jgi:hypothetical protein